MTKEQIEELEIVNDNLIKLSWELLEAEEMKEASQLDEIIDKIHRLIAKGRGKHYKAAREGKEI